MVISISEWLKARLMFSLLCCFLTQETLLHIVSLHPWKCIKWASNILLGGNAVPMGE